VPCLHLKDGGLHKNDGLTHPSARSHKNDYTGSHMMETVGPYQILGKLGAGGMGEVYKALDPRIQRQVALKILPDSLAQDTGRRRRFEQEARLAASLNHPNIMAIYDVGLDHSPPYIICELVPGESLRCVINKGAAHPRKAVDIAAQIASGLAAAHAAGIVHRDLKPENVVLTPEGAAKILDFGLARAESRAPASSDATVDMAMDLASTVVGTVVGTPAYMSPEQARAEEADHRSDQFSLGLILYELLSGKPAFERPSAVEIMSAIVRDDPPPIEQPVPASLRYILQRCLAKEPCDRYESTRDLARELAQLRDHYSEFATQTGTQPAVTVASPRQKRAFRYAALAAAALILGWSAAMLLRNPRSADLANYRFTPFATDLPSQTFPVWSPDGKSLAFYGKPESGSMQVYVQGLDAPKAVPIANGNGLTVNGWSAPFWSSDSHFLYFHCDLGNENGLCRAPASGGDTVMVQRGALVSTLSPDGRTLAMLAQSAETGFRLHLMTASPPDAAPHPYNPQPFEPGIHYNSPDMAFSPDGKQILVVIALQGRGELSYLVPWPPGKARPLFSGGFPFSYTPQVSWMPDSRYLLFACAEPSRQYEIYMADSHNGRYWPVLTEDRAASTPSVSPNGSRVAYVSQLSVADVIATPLGDGPIRTLLGGFRSEQMANASPAGPQLIYVTDRRGVQEVWITSLAEGWDRPLFTPENFQVEGVPADIFLTPALSRDGSRVAVAAKGGDKIHVYTAFTSGGTPVRATSGETGIEAAPTWSPDGNWIAFEHVAGNSLKLAKVHPGSGEAPVDLGSVNSNPVPVWSPTGEWIAANSSDDALTLFSPDGKPPRKLPGGDGGPVVWSRDGKTLYHLHIDPPMLGAIDIASGKETKLRDLPGLPPFAQMNPGLCATLTSDGKSIIYTVNRARQEIWILDGIQEPRPWYMRLLGR